MSDIFSRENDQFNGSFAADGAAITFPQLGKGAAVAGAGLAAAAAVGGAGLMTQNLNIQYSQVITKVYELGTNNTYYIGGRSQGGMGLSRIIGPRPIQLAFYQKFGDVCDAATNTIELTVKAGCLTKDGAGREQNNGKSSYEARYCVIQSIAMSVAAMDMVINEQLQLMFGSLNLS